MMTIQFGPFTLDLSRRLLTRDRDALHLAPKAFELLMALVLDRPKALSKAALQQRLWPDTFVAEANLSNLVSELRECLADDPRDPRYIRTVHGFGYAFCADAVVRSPQDTQPSPLCWVEWQHHRFPLLAGVHVIGRDPHVDIRLDLPSVSRRHARLLVSAESALLEDVASKNGTFRAGVRVTTPVELYDGDTIQIGTQMVTFHTHPRMGSTVTELLVTR
jgi:DNA-binding winged helix-turn-helix (wHTH) protein